MRGRLIALSVALASFAACSSSRSGSYSPTDDGVDPKADGGPKDTSPSTDASSTDDASEAGAPEDLGPGGDFQSYADNAMAGLRSLYSTTTGLYPSTGWWNSANALTATIDYAARVNTKAYDDDIKRTFDKNSGGNFLNDYYDDEGWWALAWIDAFDLTKDASYLAMAKAIFADITTAWDDTCGGGAWWKKDRKYKNAIANELFLEIAVRLHQRTPGDAGAGSYLDWAQREWAWFDKSGMINADSLINDGLSDCKSNGQTTWTYNQGVILGGLVDLAEATQDPTLLDRADAIASATISKLIDDAGVLREPCEPSCDKDQPQFKGIFMRNFAALAAKRPSAAKTRFITHNADWAWNAARRGTGDGTRFGLRWSQGVDHEDAARQASALDLLNASIPYDAPQENLALGKVAKASGSCSGNESAEYAVDGDVSTKWCGPPDNGPSFLELDLGESTSVGRIILRHAGAGGENTAFNTKDFSIRTSTDGTTWSDRATVTSNTRSVTIHRVAIPVLSRYVRVEVTTPQSAPDVVAARIDELEIYAR